MSNAIQLDLFHGKVLTVEQQEEVNRFIKNQAERAIKAEKRNSKIMLMLILSLNIPSQIVSVIDCI